VDKKSILIVDDDKTILKSLQDVLRLEGYYVDGVETGREALEKSEAGFYNLALIDIKLPDMEGTELLKKMHDSFPKMIRIIVTGYPDLENAVKSLNFGADAYLVKPVDTRKLLKVVAEKMREQQEAEEITQEKVGKWIETRVRKLRRGEL